MQNQSAALPQQQIQRANLMANLADGNTQTDGKFNVRAVFAFHTASASRAVASRDKAALYQAVHLMRLTRIHCGIYRNGDFHEARLP
jgi:hypothetical protein